MNKKTKRKFALLEIDTTLSHKDLRARIFEALESPDIHVYSVKADAVNKAEMTATAAPAKESI